MHVVQRRTLAQGPAQQAAGIAAGALWMPPDEVRLGVGSQRGQSAQVSEFDQR